MRIGLVRRGFSATGGAETYLRRFGTALKNAGHEPVLFTTAEWPRSAWPDGSLVTVAGRGPAGFARKLRDLQPHAFCDRLFSLERIFECDCYRAGDGVHRSWLERRARFEPKYETWFRTLRPSHRDLLGIEEHLFRAGGAGQVIANSLMVRSEIVRLFDYPQERIHVIYNGVPPPADRLTLQRLRDETRASLEIPPQTTVVLFLGSGWERKGLNFAIDAMRQVQESDILLLIAGKGNTRIHPSSAAVRFLGPVPEPRSLFAAADIFLLPTLYDPFSNASLEAAAHGLPVLTTRANGFSELIQDGVTGSVLSDPPNADEIARALQEWSNPDLRAASTDLCRTAVETLTIEENVRQTLAVLLQPHRP